MNPAAWRLSTRITTLCLGVAILLAAIAGYAALTASRHRDELNREVASLGPLRVDSALLLAAALDEQAGLANFALSGSAADLGRYVAAEHTAGTLLRQMYPLARLWPGQDAALTGADLAMANWRTDLAQPVLDLVTAGRAAQAQALLARDADPADEAVRQAIGDLQASLRAVRNNAVTQLAADANRELWLLVAASVVVLLAGIGLAVVLRRLVSVPLARLARDAQAVAAGDFGHHVAQSGPPELMALAGDVETMRQRVVNDLEAVIAARVHVEVANAALQRQAAELSRSNRDLEQFAYIASHDLQEPLRKVASFCQLLARRYAGQLDERANQYIFFAADGAQRMQRLINDLLDFSRIGRDGRCFAPVALGQLVAQVTRELDGVIELNQATVVTGDLPTVVGDESLLRLLLTNLIGNALKFRRPQVAPVVTVAAGRTADGWQISCADNGIGIDGELADKAFTIFGRLHPRDAYPGTGIGLAVAMRIVEHHGGSIWLDPTPGAGTTVRFTLPDRAGLPYGQPHPAGGPHVASQLQPVGEIPTIAGSTSIDLVVVEEPAGEPASSQVEPCVVVSAIEPGSLPVQPLPGWGTSPTTPAAVPSAPDSAPSWVTASRTVTAATGIPSNGADGAGRDGQHAG